MFHFSPYKLIRITPERKNLSNNILYIDYYSPNYQNNRENKIFSELWGQTEQVYLSGQSFETKV